MLRNKEDEILLTTKQLGYPNALCHQPIRITPDFKKPDGEADVVKAYKKQLGKTKHHKFKTVSKS